MDFCENPCRCTMENRPDVRRNATVNRRPPRAFDHQLVGSTNTLNTSTPSCVPARGRDRSAVVVSTVNRTWPHRHLTSARACKPAPLNSGS
jgi:hypothetical protein